MDSSKLCLVLLGLSCTISGSAVPPSDCSYETSRHLTCHLSSINSRLEKTDFSVVPNNTLSLTVICTQDVVGQMEPAGFSALTHLHHLVLEGCNLESIPTNAFRGLHHLKTLTVRTGNQEPLRIEAGALNHLTNLEVLDLSMNSIRDLPADQLCKLEKLALLNISHNEIGSAFDLGIDTLAGARGCLSTLQKLDLSHNQLTSLDNNSIFALHALENLNLNNNYIRFVSGGVFSAGALRNLDLSNNQISHLPANLFESVPLRELSLANNSLSALPPAIFRAQFELENLDLAGNILMTDSLSANLTQDLLNLLKLDMCQNHLQSVPYEFMAPLVNLQSLKICGNKLSQISFPGPMINLVNLDLSRNQLRNIEPHYFSGLSALNQLSLSGNQLSTIHPSAFNNNTLLLILDLSNNNMFQIPASLKNLTNLQTIDLSANQISRLDAEVVENLSSLWRLQIHDNLMVEVPVDFFSPLTSLQVLDISNNRLERFAPGALDLNPALRAIRLDGNHLREIDGIFTKLPQLIWLNVSNNEIEEFDYTLVPRTLHWLDISHNQIRDLGNYFNIENSSLTFLDASFNRLQQISSSNLPMNLETILLNDNHINDISQYAFFDKQSLVKVDLSVNKLTGFGKSTLLLSPLNTEETSFSLGGNPIVCDCEMTWFKTINSGETLDNYPLISDLESIYCRLVYTKEQAFIPLVEARNDQFLCSYDTHCFSLCQCCQFDSCDCEMTCPEGCSCYHDNSWTKNIIQCSATESQSIPDNIPMDATEIFLDGNNYHTLRSHTFIGRKNLRSLHLNNSNIEKIENHTFNGLKSLTSLHLQNNNIQSLQGFEFATLSNLRELYLQGNQINFIHNATFKVLKNLEVLFLQGNSIIDFPVWELALNPYLVSIRLAENLWSCDCSFMNKMSNWFKGFGHKVYDSEDISCISNEATMQNTRLLDYQVLPCDSEGLAVAKTQVQERAVNDYMPMMIAMLASFALVILLALVTFMFRNSIRVWVHSKYGVRMFTSLESKAESGKLFDAYLSYSPVDETFVRQVLSPGLETGNRFQLCLHHRDLPANTVTSDTVVTASAAAQRTIILLSNNFLKTEWGRYDYKSGLLQAVNNGSKKIVLVVLGSLEGSLLDPNMRLLLKTNIVLHWGEQLFWEKIKYLLPDQAEHRAQPQTPSAYSTYRSSLNSSTYRSSLNSSVRGTNTNPPVQGTHINPPVGSRGIALHI